MKDERITTTDTFELAGVKFEVTITRYENDPIVLMLGQIQSVDDERAAGWFAPRISRTGISIT